MALCPFCHRTGDSREHLCADWISSALGPQQYTFRHRKDSGDIHQWHGPKINVKARVPCGHCNNGWMSQLENKEAKPILKDMIVHGAPLSIMPRGIASLAAYAFKTAVIPSYMRIDRSKFFTRTACAHFARTLQVPLDVQVWIAALSTRQASRRGVFRSTYGKTPRDFMPSFELYVCTFAIGFVVLQVVATRIQKTNFPFFWCDPRF
jgi:hypothetical protein